MVRVVSGALSVVKDAVAVAEAMLSVDSIDVKPVKAMLPVYVSTIPPGPAAEPGAPRILGRILKKRGDYRGRISQSAACICQSVRVISMANLLDWWVKGILVPARQRPIGVNFEGSTSSNRRVGARKGIKRTGRGHTATGAAQQQNIDGIWKVRSLSTATKGRKKRPRSTARARLEQTGAFLANSGER